MRRRHLMLCLAALAPLPAAAQAPVPAQTAGEGLATVQSRHGVEETLRRFEAAVRERNWVVFTRLDHAAAAEAVGLQLRPRTVIVFGNPRAGTPAMAANPTLALDLPLRVLVWEDEQGRVQVTRNTAAWIATGIYRRHGITLPDQAEQGMEALLAGLVRQATE